MRYTLPIYDYCWRFAVWNKTIKKLLLLFFLRHHAHLDVSLWPVSVILLSLIHRLCLGCRCEQPSSREGFWYLHGGGEEPSQRHGYQAPGGSAPARSRAIAGHRQSDFLGVQRLARARCRQRLLFQTGQEEASTGQGVSYRAPSTQRKGQGIKCVFERMCG